MNNFYKWSYIILIFVFIGIYIYEAVENNKERRKKILREKRLHDIDFWPNLKFDIKFIWHVPVLLLSALIIGICSGFLFNLEKFIPIPAISFMTFSLEDDILPSIFSFSTLFIWNYLRKSLEWCLRPFSIFSKKVFITIVIIWVALGIFFAIFYGSNFYNKIIYNLPESIIPLHVKIKSGDILKDGDSIFLVVENK
jgi:hypothetical protein